ncbi:MAG: beta-galactosidase, partial [Sphaerotilus sulfidivorans]|uniref:beta-galactosidase n=1 Tax=Sphaerotilus sulfidivorans TaxID=639200 RepID=UPI003F3BE7BB
GRWWVMEQQPGPVNWAHWNPAPEDGMVRLWSWQAFAHGAEVVSYFRWRQAPFAQEQMHTGLLRPDASEDQGAIEAAQVGAELAALTLDEAGPVRLAVQAPVAMVFDYAAIWMLQIQPQGADFNPLELQFRAYEGLRRLGLDVDLVPADADLSGYRLIVLAAQPQIGATLQASLEAAAARGAQIVLGPRAGSKSAHLSFPAGDSPTGHGLPPGPLSALAGVQVRRVASLPPGCAEPVVIGEQTVPITRWREDLALAEGTEVLAAFADGRPALTRRGPVRCIAGWLGADGWQAVLTGAAADAGLAAQTLPEGLRLSRAGDLLLAFNFSDRCLDAPALPTAAPLLGQRPLPPRGLAIWRI